MTYRQVIDLQLYPYMGIENEVTSITTVIAMIAIVIMIVTMLMIEVMIPLQL